MEYQQQGGSLQNYNNDLVKCLQDLRQKREIVHKEIISEEREKARVQKQLAELTEQLQRLNMSISKKTQSRNDYDKTIQETEAAYMKVYIYIYTHIYIIFILQNNQNIIHSNTDIGIITNFITCFKTRNSKFE